MKRYNFWHEYGSQTWRSAVSDDGEWVLYDDIKDDRALLEEAVKELEKCDKYLNADVDNPLAPYIKVFLARAKERGIG